jgi:hypothetical protein
MIMKTQHYKTYGLQQKFIAVKACIKKNEEWSQTNNLLTKWNLKLAEEKKNKLEIKEIEHRMPTEKAKDV